MEVRLCRWCGLPFEQKRITNVFCGKSCLKKYHRAQERMANPLPVFTVTCPECGKVFDTDDRRRKYCSSLCKKKSDNRKANEHDKQKRLEARMNNQRYCAFCEKPLPLDAPARQKFCTPSCQHRFANRGGKAEYKACVACKRMYIPRNSKQKYCSPECSGGIPKRQGTPHSDCFMRTTGRPLPDMEKGLREKEKAAKAAGMSYGKYQAMLYMRGTQTCKRC